MDVHRSRFVPHPVRPITAIAFTRSSDEKLPKGFPQPTLRLAIGRDNGHIEVWNPLNGKWVQETVFVGGSSSKSIDGLVWTREPDERGSDGQPVLGQHRLFSIASSPDVTEWDLQTGTPKKKSTGNFSEAWCFAAQPRQQQPSGNEEQKSQDLVAGCGDGSIVLLSTTADDLQFQRFLARVSGKKAKCMSITYQTRDRVVAGFADSNIRVIDTRNGSILRTMSLGPGVPPAPKTKFVWKVKCLPNGDIVSGDSNGDVVFWDGRSYSLTQRIKGHDSDCIDIVTSEDGRTIFTGSLDGRLAVYHQITNPAGRRSWAKTHHRRTHTKSEVKAMSAYDSKDLSVVVSGGGDLAPMITPMREYGKENVRPLPHLPQQSPLTSARHARLLVSWAENHISVWKIARSQTVEFSPEPEAPRRLVAKITLNTKQTIRSAAVSDDGKLLVAATDADIKAFQLRKRPDSDVLVPRKLDVPESLANEGARMLHFSPDSKWLAIVKLNNEVHVARAAVDPEKPKHVQILGHTVELERADKQLSSIDAFRAYDQTITRLAFSSDGCALAASDMSGHLDTWVLEGHEDPTAPAVDVTVNDSKRTDSNDDGSSDSSDDEENELVVYYGQHWAENPARHLLPKLDSAPLVLTFRPTSNPAQSSTLVNGNPGVHFTRHNPHAHSHELPKGPYKLWIMTAKHQMYEFDVLAGRLTDWSRNNPTSVLPEDFNRARDRVMGAVWDVSAQRERIWLYGSNWLFMLNVSINLPNKKRRQSEGGAEMQTPKRLKTSGAGSRTIAAERDGLPGRLLRIEDGIEMEVDLDNRQSKADNELEQEDPDEELELRLARVKSTDDEVVNADVKERRWWCTFKYRPILGVVTMEDSAGIEQDQTLEVVVVERPVWEILESAKNGK